jgi:DNA-binding transcriptional ArsR family regulator
MSIEAVSWALKQNLPPSEKLVLVSLADHHNRATGLCIPGQASVGEQTCMSVRTVQRHLKSLESRGLIVRQARFRSEGRGRTSDSYVLQGDNLTPKHQGKGDKSGTTKATNQDDQHDTVVVAITGREPEGNRKIVSSRTKKTSVPSSYAPDEQLAEQISSKWPKLRLDEEVEKFQDYHRAKGSKFVDWDAAFRNWCRNADKFRLKAAGMSEDGFR